MFRLLLIVPMIRPPTITEGMRPFVPEKLVPPTEAMA